MSDYIGEEIAKQKAKIEEELKTLNQEPIRKAKRIMKQVCFKCGSHKIQLNIEGQQLYKGYHIPKSVFTCKGCGYVGSKHRNIRKEGDDND